MMEDCVNYDPLDVLFECANMKKPPNIEEILKKYENCPTLEKEEVKQRKQTEEEDESTSTVSSFSRMSELMSIYDSCMDLKHYESDEDDDEYATFNEKQLATITHSDIQEAMSSEFVPVYDERYKKQFQLSRNKNNQFRNNRRGRGGRYFNFGLEKSSSSNLETKGKDFKQQQEEEEEEGEKFCSDPVSVNVDVKENNEEVFQKPDIKFRVAKDQSVARKMFGFSEEQCLAFKKQQELEELLKKRSLYEEMLDFNSLNEDKKTFGQKVVNKNGNLHQQHLLIKKEQEQQQLSKQELYQEEEDTIRYFEDIYNVREMPDYKLNGDKKALGQKVNEKGNVDLNSDEPLLFIKEQEQEHQQLLKNKIKNLYEKNTIGCYGSDMLNDKKMSDYELIKRADYEEYLQFKKEQEQQQLLLLNKKKALYGEDNTVGCYGDDKEMPDYKLCRRADYDDDDDDRKAFGQMVVNEKKNLDLNSDEQYQLLSNKKKASYCEEEDFIGCYGSDTLDVGKMPDDKVQGDEKENLDFWVKNEEKQKDDRKILMAKRSSVQSTRRGCYFRNATSVLNKFTLFKEDDENGAKGK